MENIKDDSRIDALDEKVKIFPNDDERLKLIGEILSNESSRTILKLLVSNEHTAQEIVEKTDLSLSLVLHHVNKMQVAGIVKVSRISQTSKNQEMKHYTAAPGIIILPRSASDAAKNSKVFQSSLKRIIRLCSIAIAAAVAWFASQALQSGGPVRPTPPPYDPVQIQLFWPVTITLLVVITGLIVEWFFSSRRSKNIP